MPSPLWKSNIEQDKFKCNELKINEMILFRLFAFLSKSILLLFCYPEPPTKFYIKIIFESTYITVQSYK